MRIFLYARFNHTGIGRHAENFFKAFEQLLAGSIEVKHIDPDRPQSAQQLLGEVRPQDVTLFFTLQDPLLVSALAGAKIIWFAFESNRLPGAWVELLNGYDGVWVPSGWGLQVLVEGGVLQNKISVVAEGVDGSIYHPQASPHNHFVFLTVGKYEKRKSIGELIQAFVREFPAPAYGDIRLRLKADFPMFPQLVDELKKAVSFDPRIEVEDGIRDDAGMAALYRGVDAFIFPSRAEGFGLTCLEAMASGVPAAALPYSGQTEYLGTVDQLYVPIAFAMEPIEDGLFSHFFSAAYAGEAFGEWARPELASLQNALRELYENGDVWRSRALEASEILRSRFSWEASAAAAGRALGQLLDQAGGVADAP